MFDSLPYINTGEVTIEPGALLVNYTDGLSEAMNNDGKLFETEGMIDFIQQNIHQSVGDMNAKLIEHVIAFKQDTDFDDDITLLSLRFK